MFFFMGNVYALKAQQLPQSSFFTDAIGFWNPAYTGIDDALSVNARVRQQWFGFGGGAPTTINLDAQYPVLDLNMAFGGGLLYDKTGPVSKAGISMNYAYSLNEIAGGDAKLSFGILASGYQYTYDPSSEKARDSGDPLLADSRQTAFFPNVGAGVFFISSAEKYDGNTAFRIGLSAQQAYETDVLTDELNQKRIMQLNGDIGLRWYTYETMIEPHASLNITSPDVLYGTVGVNYEMAEAFWAGLGYATSGDMTIQGGFILEEISGRYSRLKIGLLGNVPISNRISQFGPTAEVYMRYEVDQR